MAYAPAYDTAVTREAAWFTAEPPASFPAAPPLISTSGGPFDVVQGYLRAETGRGRSLYILRESTEESRISMGGEKEWRHHMLAVVLWDRTKSKLETVEQDFDTAVAAVLTRIRGPLGDKSHGGAFVGVAEDQSEIRIETQNYLEALFSATEPFETHIRYIATDVFGA